MKEFKYVIKDEQGIHARPAGLFVKEAAAFPCKVINRKRWKRGRCKTYFCSDGSCSQMWAGDHLKDRWRKRRRGNE